MSFSDWTKKRQQQNGGASAAQQTGTRATASSSAANIARDDKPSSFGEWTRKNQGVTAWRDEEVGFNQWLEQMSRFSSKAGSDYQSRVDNYQSADDITKYRDDTYRSMDALSKKGQDYRTYFQAYKSMYDEMYGAETTQQILSTLDEGSKYLDSLRGGVDSAYNFWSQFRDEDDYNTYKKGQEYATMADAPDFAEKSQYKSTRKSDEEIEASKGPLSFLVPQLGLLDFGDITYDYINGNEDALAKQEYSDADSGLSFAGIDSSFLRQMKDDEIAIFNYLYAQDTANGDTEHSNAYAYIDYLTKELNYRQRAKAEEEWAAYANEHPVGSSVFSVLESPLKGVSYLGQFADWTADGTIDQNAGYNKFSYINSAIRNEVNTIVEDKWGGVGSFAYQTGMSMGDFLFNTAITGGNQALTLAIMGTGAAADTTISAKDRGLSDNQAFALGTIAGAAEIITEKVSLDALLDKTSLTKNAMGYFLKNTLAEGSEEVGSDLINLAADIFISKDKSEWRQSIQAYIDMGYSEAEATGLAVRDQALTMGLDFLGGAVSGGVMSGAGIAVNSGLNEYSARQTGAEFNAMGDDVVLATIQEGLASDPSTRSYQLAQQLQQKLDNGETITNAELGRLYQANVQAIDAEDASGDILLRAADEVARKGRVTNSTATDILDNPSAMNTLAQEAGLSVTEDMSKAQQRKAVKTAVEGLARARETAAGETVTTATSQQEKAAETAQVRPAAQQVHDIKRMQQAASALGENGAKALTAAYDGSVASDSFYAGFVAYYEAGVSGMDMSKVRSEYSAQLNQAQKFAAYVAGQNDAEVSLARERRAAQYAKVAGTDSGLVFDDYVASSMDTATADRVNSIAKALGVRVRFVDSVRGGTANAQVSGSDILVEKNNPNPVMFLLGHEWTHRMQELAPTEYRAFREAVAEEAQGEARVLLDQYRRAGENISYEDALDEAAANYAGRMIEDGKVLDDFIEKHRDNRTLLEKVRDAIRSIIAKLTGAERRQAQTAEGKLTAALEASAKQANALQNGGSVVGTEGGYAKVNGKFSLKGVVEDNGELLALHNLTENNLLDALELGGLPMPSIAIVQAREGHAMYGEISLVFGKDTIDPQADRRNKIYGSDAWTPTHSDARVDYEVDYDVKREFEQNIETLANDVAGGIFSQGSVLDMAGVGDQTSMSVEEIAHRLATRYDSVRAAYLANKGQDIDIVYRTKEFDSFGNDALKSYLEKVGEQEAARLAAKMLTGERLSAAEVETVKDAIMESWTAKNEWRLNKKPELRETRIAKQREKLSDLRAEDFARNAWDFYEDGGTTTDEVNRMETAENLRHAVDDKAVEAWVLDMLRGLTGEPGIYNGSELFDARGNRKSFKETHWSYTLENIVRAMNNAKTRGQGMWGMSGSGLVATATPAYNSVREMHADESRLRTVDSSEYEQMVKDLDGELDRVAADIMHTTEHHASNTFEEEEIIGDVIAMAAQGKRTTAGVKQTFRKEGYTISDKQARAVLNVIEHASSVPTGYFEAKPQRAVGFDEVLAAVIPDDSSEKLRTGLEQAGVRTLEYKSGDDTDRLAKVNSVEGARFSLKTDSQGRTLTEQQREYFKDSKAVDDQGRLMVMYHGTTAYGEITKFRKGRSGWLGPGIYLSSRKEDAQRYADAMGEGNGSLYELYANVTNPLVVTQNNPVPEILLAAYGRESVYKNRSAKQGNDTHIITPADIKKLQSKGYDGIRWDFGGNTELSVFSPEQLKRVDNTSPTGNQDIRYSIKGSETARETAKLREENDLLRERVEYWRGQTRRTKRVTTDKKAVTRAARELIRSYGADLETTDISGELQSLYDYIASGYDGSDELTYTEARRRAEAIARKLVESAVTVDDDMYQQYSDLRSYLRTTKLTISEEDSHNIADYGDFRKRNIGRMTLTKGDTNIDRVYEEMAELWPEFFDPQRETHPADQLTHIADVMDGIYDIEEYNPFSNYMEQAVTGAANEIMEQFFDLPQTRATFADRQARKLEDAKAKGRQQVQKVREQSNARLEELREQNRQRVQDAIAKERDRRDKQIEKLKTRYREKDAAGRERRNARELRAKIVRHANALSQKLLRPSDKQHIPESLRQATAAALDAINLESAYSVDPATGKRVKDGTGTPTKRTEAFRKLRLAYAEIAKDGGDYTLIIDPDLMDNLNELESMKDTPLMQMGTSQLETVWATIKAVEASIRTANKMLGASRFETISAFAEGIKVDNLTRKDRGDFGGNALGKMLAWGDKKANFDMLTPQGYFHRLGKTGEEMFRMMRSAQDRHIEIMRQAQEATRKITGKADINKLERETHTFDLEGGKLTMSTAQVMSLYELMKREQARDHILKGGIRPDTITGGRALREDRRSAPVHVTAEDLATITGVLTEEQRRMADGLQKFMGGDLAELGNEASMEVYGYRKFNERDYFPIQVDKNQTKRDIAKEAQAATIAGRGFTKSVTPHANNAVMLNSIFDVYASHVNDMATYAAWLPTMENIRRIRDFTFRDEEGNRTGDVKSIIERVFGKNGNPYLNKLVDDINQGIKPSGTGGMNALVGNYKAAAVAANIRVILQQPTAILRAMNTLDPKYLLSGTVKRGDWGKVKKYAPIAVWKDWGYFDINTGRQMKDVLLNSDSALEKVKQASMAPAGKADGFAWARLWNAVEAETKDKRPGLKPGTDDFYRAVASRFGEIIDGTQVVDGLLQRSQIMRSPDALDKMATSFMGEPTKTYNMFVNAVYDLRHAEGKDGRKQAKRSLARTTTALVVSFAVNAVMQSIVDALRDDDKERDYWEKLLTAYTGFTGDEETFLDYWNSFWSGNLEANFNPMGYLPYFKDMLSIAQGYDVSRMDMEPISKVWDAAVNMEKALSGEGKYSLAGASANLLAEAARLLGIPVANLKRDIQAGITTAAIETDSYLMQYRIDKAMLNMGYSGNTSNFMDILYNASINDREAYEIIYADMVASGIQDDKISNAMETRMKRDQGVESVADLEARYLTPKQEQSYNSLRQRVTGTSVWSAASAEQREALEEDLYDLTVANSSGLKLQEKIDGGAAYGIDEADYLLYRLALHVVDQPTESGNLGSYTGDEVEAAIDMLTGLDDEARAYLWEAAGKSEKSNPYK